MSMRIALAVIPVLTLNFAFSQEEAVEPIEVIGTSPLHGIGISEDRFPSYVESESYKEMESQRTLNLTDYMGIKLPGVYLSTDRSNAFQNNIIYRGFTSSWLIGQPQGLSIYLDGVRMNEPFSDVMNWDIIPDRAVESMNLFSGSNPIFGLNSLGGALSIQTKDAFSFPKKEMGTSVGSFDTRSVWVEGGYRLYNRVGVYVMGDTVRGKGWRDFSYTDINRGFLKLSYLLDSGILDLSFLSVDNEIHSTDVLLEKLLSLDRKMAFTAKDIYKNDSYMVNHRGNYQLGGHITLDWNAYYRNSRSRFASGDMTDLDVDGGLLVENDGTPVVDKRGQYIHVAQDQIPGVINRTSVAQEVYGGAFQASLKKRLGKAKNRLSVGVDLYRANIDYLFDIEFGVFKPDREVAGTGRFLGHPDGSPEDVYYRDVKGENTVYGVYLVNVLTPFKPLDLFLGARYNYAQLKLEDRTGFLSGINGTNIYKRLNPMIGLSFEFYPNYHFYASYFESSRIPTPIEITCSDPTEECRLPSAFVEDPPLKQVVGKTVETGVKGVIASDLEWSLSLFNTDLHNDILLVSGRGINQVYFKNVSKTQRRGVQLSFEGNIGRFELFGGYTLLLATFRTTEKFSSPNHPKVREVCPSGGNPDVDCATNSIIARPGDRIPGIPEHSVKLGVNYGVTHTLKIGANLVYSSGVYLVGDEANLDKKTDPYTVVNLLANYKRGKLAIFGRVDNVFDKKYETTGRYVSLDDASNLNPYLPVSINPDRDSPRALAPGVPRNFTVGVAYTF